VAKLNLWYCTLHVHTLSEHTTWSMAELIDTMFWQEACTFVFHKGPILKLLPHVCKYTCYLCEKNVPEHAKMCNISFYCSLEQLFETLFWQGSILYISIPRRSNCTIFFWTMQIRMQLVLCGKGVSRCMTYHLLKFSTTSWNHVLTRTLYISLPQRSIFTKSPDACKYTCIFWRKEWPWACLDVQHVI